MKKNLTYYLNLNYPITIETSSEDKELHYSLEIPDLPGCGAEAKTLDEALEKLQDAKDLWISVGLKRKLPIPEPVSEDDFSGKFLLRIPTKLHMDLAKQAKREGFSLNQYVKSILEMHTTLAYQKQEIEERYKELLQEIRSSREKATVIYGGTSESILTITSGSSVIIGGPVTASTSIPFSFPEPKKGIWLEAA